MPHVPDRLRAGFVREAREALDGQTLELLEGRSSDGSLTMAIDRFCDAALGLGQATWGWAQTIDLEATGDLTRFERMPADVA